MTKIDIIKLGYYSPSQNGVIVSKNGCAPCVCGGGKGHDVDVPKILIDWNDDQTVLYDPCQASCHRRRQMAAPCKRMHAGHGKLSESKDVERFDDKLPVIGAFSVNGSID